MTVSSTSTTTSIGPPRAASTGAQAQTASVGARLLRGITIGLAVVVVLFAATYALAWWRASQLTATFMADANASYSAGNYIESLTGYEEFDRATNRYVTHGGYMKAAQIWSDPRAWPVPGSVALAQARIDEILAQRLTIEEAETFIQTNIGKQNPYMSTIYLRLGELYEQEGDIQSAAAIYEEIPELFPGEAALIERAKANLDRLNNS